MFTLIIRSILLYLLILVVIRLMGKRQIGQMQPFELVLTLIIADIATIPMGETKIPFLHGIVPLLTLMVVHFVIAFFCNTFNKFNSIVNGKPVIVVDSSGINEKALKALNISVDDIMEGIRGKGFFSLSDVHYVIVETTGIINVLPKASSSPATLQDLKIEKENPKLPIMLVSDGQKMVDNIKTFGIDEGVIEKILKIAKIKKVKNVLAMYIQSDGQVFVQAKKKTCQTFSIGEF